MQGIRDKIYNTISYMYSVDVNDINDDVHLCDILDILDVINLALELEDVFDINMQDIDLNKFKTVGDIVRYIYNLVKGLALI